MNKTNNLPAINIAKKILVRDNAKLLQSFLSLLVSAIALTVILGLIGSVRSYLLNKSTELLGGDVVIEKSLPFTEQESPAFQQLKNQGAEIVSRIQTTVMLSSPDTNRSVLSTVKIVSEKYPLYGSIQTKPATTSLPSDIGVFAEQSFADRMEIKVGDKVTIGDIEYFLEAILITEPDQFSTGFTFGPKVLMSQTAWERAGIANDASRIQYAQLLKIPNIQEKSALIEQMRTEYRAIRARVSVAEDGPQRLLNVITIAERFFLTFILLSLFLVVVNIRTNLVFLLNYFIKTIAVFRILGMRRKTVLSIFILLLLTISVIAGLLGAFIGNALIGLLLPLTANIVEGVVLSAPAIYANIHIALIFTILISFFSALPILLKIIEIEPKMILAQFANTTSKNSFAKNSIATVVSLIALWCGMYFLTKDFYITSISIAVVTGVFIVFLLLIQLLLTFLYKKRFSLPFYARSVVNFTKNQGIVGVSAIASLTLALATIFTLSLIDANVNNYLQSQIKENAPNLYVLDIQKDQAPEVQSYFKNNLTLFPVTRARFIRTDSRYYKRENEADREFLREFNITHRTELIEGEELVQGTWHGSKAKNQVSVEKEFAESAGIKLGSEVELSIQGVPIVTKVTSIRTVETTQGLPFFYFVFTPDVLEKAPQTFFGYAFVPEKEIPVLQNTISKRFPSISTIPTADVLKTIQSVIQSLSLAILITSVPALLLGLFLIFGMMANVAQERFRNLLLFKVFGSSSRQVFFMYMYEAMFSVVFASFFALIFSVIGTIALNQYVFEFKGFYFSPNVLYIFLLVIAFTILFSFYLIRVMKSKTPTELLREQ